MVVGLRMRDWGGEQLISSVADRLASTGFFRDAVVAGEPGGEHPIRDIVVPLVKELNIDGTPAGGSAPGG